jgi:hypothetical protein
MLKQRQRASSQFLLAGNDTRERRELAKKFRPGKRDSSQFFHDGFFGFSREWIYATAAFE